MKRTTIGILAALFFLVMLTTCSLAFGHYDTGSTAYHILLISTLLSGSGLCALLTRWLESTR